MDKPVYLGLLILDLSKTVMFEKCKTKIWWKCTNLLWGYRYVFKDTAEDVEKRFGTLIDRPLPIAKNKKCNWTNERWIKWTNPEKFIGLSAKTCSYLKDNNEEDKKAKGTKKCVIKRNLKFRDFKKCLKASEIEIQINYLEKKKNDVDCLKEDKKELLKNKLILKTEQRFKSERHKVFTEVINKITLS